MGRRRYSVSWHLSVSMMIALLASPPTSSLSPDGQALLEMKSAFNDTAGALWSWRESDSDPCAWFGVTCRRFPDLRVSSINLPHLQLKGAISPSIGKLQRLERLALHQNNLHGPIPSEIKNCTQLKALYLRANYLQGSIPPEIGDLLRLTILDLSSNLLTGNIPDSLGRLSNLRFLNLSNNFFSGGIPNVGVLSTFTNSSFVGNVELCGLQIKKLCRGSLGFPAVLPHSQDIASQGFPPIPNSKSPHFVNGVVIGAMSSMGLAIVALLCFLWLCLLSRKGNKLGERYVKVNKQHLQADTGNKLLSFQCNLPYSSQEITKKLELLDEDNVVGIGGFGTVYKMVMDDNSAFAVKRIDWNRGDAGCDESFERELTILGSIMHINVVNLRGYCRFPSAKLLIYDFLALGSLDKYLHDHEDDGEEGQGLNWNARMKIAIGSARGLAYLHHDCSPAIVHQDIKSSNILLDRSLEPHLSDFGLAKLLAVDDHDTNVTTVVAGSFGYLAPEYLNNGCATEKSDVYSFGVLLLELVTGKRPTDESFVKRGLNIVGWLNTLSGEDQRADTVVDGRCGGEIDAEAVEAVLDIAAMCTDANPETRPTMSQVLQMLEEENAFYDSRIDM